MPFPTVQNVPELTRDQMITVDRLMLDDYGITLTLALPKSGLAGAPQVGELYCADISVPPELYTHPSLGISPPALFTQSDIIRLP